jgi:hypothetical protein
MISARYAGLAYDDRALSVQAHPEYDDGFIDDLMQTRGKGVVPEPLMDQAAPASAADDLGRIAARIVDFFKQTR